jgi:methylmalonyl-CoA/ethylmalonyl-CoA epimerase
MNFHHIGVACNDIFHEMELFMNMGYTAEHSFVDKTLGVRGQFMSHESLPRIELLENFQSSVLNPWLTSGSPFYHLGIMCSEEEFLRIRQLGREIVSTKEAIAFPRKEISFILFPGRKLIEFIH